MSERNVVAEDWQSEVGSVERAARKDVEEDCEAHALRRLRARVCDRELRPAVEERERTAVALAYEDILAARARHHRRKLRVGERAREAQEPRRHPRDNHNPRRL